MSKDYKKEYEALLKKYKIKPEGESKSLSSEATRKSVEDAKKQNQTLLAEKEDEKKRRSQSQKAAPTSSSKKAESKKKETKKEEKKPEKKSSSKVKTLSLKAQELKSDSHKTVKKDKLKKSAKLTGDLSTIQARQDDKTAVAAQNRQKIGNFFRRIGATWKAGEEKRKKKA